MERSYDDAFDDFEKTIKAIADTYYLEDCEAEINAAVDKLVQTAKDLDKQIDNLRDENEKLKEKLREKEDEAEDLNAFYKDTCRIKVESLQMREKLQHFIETELYPHFKDKQEWDFN